MAEQPRSIVVMIPGFPEDEADTTCLPAMQNYVAAFAEAHPAYQTHVIAFQYPYARRTYAWKHATVHALGGQNRRRLRRLATWLRAARVFAGLYRQTDVRALHSFWLTECTWVARRLSALFRIRHVASIGGQDAREDNPYLRRLTLDGVTLTAGSAFAADTFAQHSRPVDHVIPLGLDVAHLQTIAAPPERDIDVLGVGSLIPLKDYAAFIDIIARLVPAFPALRACLVGDGPEREALEHQIARRGLGAHVTLAGSLPRDEVFRHMLRSKVLLHPSRYESQGYVFLEARLAGLGIVSRAVGYTGTGDRIVQRDSAPAMADAVAALLHAPSTFDPAPVPSAQDTVRAFASLYGIEA